jgi:hypothetical protein
VDSSWWGSLGVFSMSSMGGDSSSKGLDGVMVVL